MRPISILLLLTAAAAAQDRAVLRDGTVLVGNIHVDAAKQELTCDKSEEPLDFAYLAEQDDGTLLWASDFKGRLMGYRILVAQRLRDAYAALVKKCILARDSGLAWQYLEYAGQNGYEGKDAEHLARRVRFLSAHPGSVNQLLRKKIVREARDLDAAYPKLLVARARAALQKDERTGLELLREALRVDPTLPAAQTLLKKLAPSRFPLGNSRLWLDWRLEVETRGGRLVPFDNPAVELLCKNWRPDVYAVREDPILLATPVRDEHDVGGCLAFGRLATRVLKALFPPGKNAPKTKRPPMIVLLFSSKEEYVKRSPAGHMDPSFLQMTYGHYSPDVGLTSFYWSKDPDAERQIFRTVVHELTHQWLQEQNPQVPPAMVRAHTGTPAYWIVEGFATFLEEGVYDIDRGKWRLFDPKAPSLDMVSALAGTGRLLPWDRVYSLRAREFGTLDVKMKIPLIRHWTLGKYHASAMGLFYMQAAATCQYLYNADGGKHRKQLLDYVDTYYRGTGADLDIRYFFHETPEELGKKVEAFAQAVAKGWRPK